MLVHYLCVHQGDADPVIVEKHAAFGAVEIQLLNIKDFFLSSVLRELTGFTFLAAELMNTSLGLKQKPLPLPTSI